MNTELHTDEYLQRRGFISTTGCRKRTSGGTSSGCVPSQYNTIANGYQNNITNCSLYNNVTNGRANLISGYDNIAAANYANMYNSIGNGYNNFITGNSYHNTIGGGLNNYIFRTATLLTGNVIGGGGANCITSSYSVISGGCNNSISGAYSAILGGSGNTDSGYNYVGIFGCNIAATCPGFFYVNDLVTCSIPAGNPATCAPPGTVPPGGLYFVCIGAYKQVWVA
ncbi:MAG: hypothetical protein BGO69_06630 [Bacteroidetes bacterium 46-16]|nr:MAG: hypothetical protein BGO69_06630 [Bacteroidetes bacterium 46-16]